MTDFRATVATALAEAPAATGKVHDYSRGNVWSHACYFRVHEEGLRIDGDMFASMVRAGDWLLLPNKGKATRYRITEVKWMRDPYDMYRFKAVFDPRTA